MLTASLYASQRGVVAPAWNPTQVPMAAPPQKNPTVHQTCCKSLDTDYQHLALSVPLAEPTVYFRLAYRGFVLLGLPTTPNISEGEGVYHLELYAHYV